MKKIISITTVLIISLFLLMPAAHADGPGNPPIGPGAGDEPIGGPGTHWWWQ